MTPRVVQKEVDRDAVFLEVELADATRVRAAANVELDDDGTLFQRQLHIDGSGPNTVGPAGLREAVRQLARSWGVRRVVVDGGDRHTGAALGRAGLGVRRPRRLVFEVE